MPDLIALRGSGLWLIAPSKTPRASGEKVKYDRKDAEHLRRKLMAGELTAIKVPTRAPRPPAISLARGAGQGRGDLMSLAIACRSCFCGTGGCGTPASGPGGGRNAFCVRLGVRSTVTAALYRRCDSQIAVSGRRGCSPAPQIANSSAWGSTTKTGLSASPSVGSTRGARIP